MKQGLKTGLAMMFAFWASFSVALPLAYVEGDHYQMTTQRISVSSEKPEVVELFMYTCPHCYHLEPEVERWHSAVGDTVKFTQVPAVFGPNQVPLATAFYAAEALGKSEELHPLLFEAIHEDGFALNTEKQILDYLELQGYDRASFEKMMRSFSVKSKVNKAAKLTKMSGVDGVPSFVVNGQYHTSGPMAGSIEAIFEIVDFLISQ